MSRDPRLDPATANVFGHDHHQPYARRSFHAVFGIAFVIFIAGAFIAWFFFSKPDEPADTAQVTSIDQVVTNPYEPETPRSSVYNFFYRMFGGIEDGLDDNPHNLNNVEHLDDMNLDVDGNPVNTMLAINNYVENVAETRTRNAEDDYRHSIYDIVGSNVIGRKGENAGKIYDIVVNKETGQARAIIVNEDDSRYDRDLTAVRFKRVLKQQAGGDTMLTITEDTLEDKTDFKYEALNDEDYVSLRHLRDGQLLDFEGKVAGQVDAIIYQNAEAQSLFFTLRPLLAEQGISKIQIPFDALNIVENVDGYDVQLTKDQTEQLAEELFSE